MNGAWLLYTLITLTAVFLSGFFSGAETGIYCVNRVKLRLRSDRGDRDARRLARFLADEQSALSATLVGTNIMNYIAAAVVAFFFAHEMGLTDRRSELYTTLLVTPLIFVFGEVVPKNLFRREPDRLMYAATVALAAARHVFSPLVWVMRIATRRVINLTDATAATGDDAFVARRRVSAMLREGLIHAGSSRPEHADLVERVLALSGISVHSVMVPRNRVVVIRSDARRREFLSAAGRTPHARIPVYRSSPRRIVGWVAVHELLADASWENIGSRVKPIVFLKPHDSVAVAIVQLQQARQAMAAVVDRRGLLLGIVTLKDLIEEITGELVEW